MNNKIVFKNFRKSLNSSICHFSIFDIFHYMLFYCGIFTGPFFTYQTYYDMLNSVDGLYNIHKCRSNIWKKIIIQKFATFLFILIAFILLNKIDWVYFLFLPKYNFQNSILKMFFYKFFYLSMFIYSKKVRYLSCWFIIDMCYVYLGIGAYPQVLIPRYVLPPKINQNEALKTISFDQLKQSKIRFYIKKFFYIFL